MTPTRLLATCSCCEAWYYIDVAPDGSAALMVHLPKAVPSWTPAPTLWRELPLAVTEPAPTSTGVA
ncbi:MAG TPA: hypothetical protein VGZ22_03950 [Isosphaeraceae bacterium]|jgi:hypothetical protein|nr:hypothetical protein [Isosphaeraceae bacterium]